MDGKWRLFQHLLAASIGLTTQFLSILASAAPPEVVANIERATAVKACNPGIRLGNRYVFGGFVSQPMATCAIYSTGVTPDTLIPLGIEGVLLKASERAALVLDCAGDSKTCRLWQTDGSLPGTVAVSGFVGQVRFSSFAVEPSITTIGETAYFLGRSETATDDELWTIDTTKGIATKVTNLTLGFGDEPRASIRVNERFVFVEVGPLFQRATSKLVRVDRATRVAETLFQFDLTKPVAEFVGQLVALDNALLVRISSTIGAEDSLVGIRNDASAPEALATMQTQEFLTHKRMTGAFFSRCIGSTTCEVWTTDGTGPGTTKLSSFSEPVAIALVSARGLLNGRLIIVSSSNAPLGLIRGVDIVSGATETLGVFELSDLLVEDGSYYFCSPPIPVRALFRSDGTRTGTVKIGDTCFGAPSLATLVSGRLVMPFGALSGDRVLSSTDENFQDVRPIEGSPRREAVFAPGAALDSKYLFSACTVAHACGMWVTDGTPDGTRVLMGGGSFIAPPRIVVAGNKAYFTASTGDRRLGLWATDGTASGTSALVTGFLESANTDLVDHSAFTAVGSRVYFAACSLSPTDCGLWESDGTTSGTHLLHRSIGPALRPVTSINNVVYYLGGNPGAPTTLYAVDASTRAAQVVATDATGFGVAAHEGKVFFARSGVLTQTDGTVGGMTPHASNISGLESVDLRSLRGHLFIRTTFGPAGPYPQVSVRLFRPGASNPETLIQRVDALSTTPITSSLGSITPVGQTFTIGLTYNSNFNQGTSYLLQEGGNVAERVYGITAIPSAIDGSFVLRIACGIAYSRCDLLGLSENGSRYYTSLQVDRSLFTFPKTVLLGVAGERVYFVAPGNATPLALWRAVLQSTPLTFDADNDSIPNDEEIRRGTDLLTKDNDIFSQPVAFAEQMYRDVFRREASPNEVSSLAQAVSDTPSRVTVLDSLLKAEAFEGRLAPIIRLYLTYFLRTPDTQGVDFWFDEYRSGRWTFVGISDFFAGSPEFVARYGAVDNAQFVRLLYANVFNRAPDAGGETFWIGELVNGRRSRGQVMADFSESQEFKTRSALRTSVMVVYLGMLRKMPSDSELASGLALLESGKTRIDLIEKVFNSAEYRSRFLP